MKLANNIRSAFVIAVMNDVPQVDYREQAQKLLIADAVAQLPPKIRAIYNDQSLRHFVQRKQEYALHQYIHVPGPEYARSEAVAARLAELLQLHDDQDAKRAELRNQIRAIADTSSTRKQLVDKLPEFEKYLPVDERAAARSLPLVANVVADFVKAGWPKDKPAPATTPAKRGRVAKSK